MVKPGAKTIVLIFLSCMWISGCRIKKNTNHPPEKTKADVITVGKLSIVQKLKENNQLPVPKKVALYHQLKKENPTVYNFEDETELTMYGYGLLWENKVLDAIEIFKLIVAEFPNSSNAYDSLGEAFLKNDNKELSLINYEKSLALNPENFTAEEQIERIKYPNRIPLKPSEKFVKRYTIKEYQDDLDQLSKTLTEVHPNTFKFITREAFTKLVEEKKSRITDSTTYGEFVWHCAAIIASIHCSHTTMGNFYPESEMLPVSLRFPLQIRWVDNKLYVIDPLNNTKKVKLKAEIRSINGIAVDKIVEDIYQHIPAQGHITTTPKHFFNTWSTAMIPFALGFPPDYEILVRGGNDPIKLNKAETYTDIFRDPSIPYCGDDLCLEFIEQGKIAVLTISSFSYYRWNNYDVFERFIDSSFAEINNKGARNLIIDLRFNGGGSQSSSIHLLKYLVDHPFTYYSNAQFEGKKEKIEGEEVIHPFKNGYKGKRYYIIDGLGKSTTGHFMSMVKYLNLGTIVGEELGSNQFCSAGGQSCRLSNTKLDYSVANNTHESTATSLPDEIGILPDHYITQRIDQYLNKVDAVKDFTIKLVKTHMKQ